MQVFLTDEELKREANLFSPNSKSYKKLDGVKLDLCSLIEQPKKADATSPAKNEKSDKPAIFVPPSC